MCKGWGGGRLSDGYSSNKDKQTWKENHKLVSVLRDMTNREQNWKGPSSKLQYKDIKWRKWHKEYLFLSSQVRETCGSLFCRTHFGLDYKCVRTSWFWIFSSTDSLFEIKKWKPTGSWSCVWNDASVNISRSLVLVTRAPPVQRSRVYDSRVALMCWGWNSVLPRNVERGPRGRFPCMAWPLDHLFLWTHGFLCLLGQGQGWDCPSEIILLSLQQN